MTVQEADETKQTGVLAELAAAGLATEDIDIVDDSPRRLAEYSYDASNYRVVPLVVVFPYTVDDVVAVVTACRATGVPLISRGGGTSMAGNAVGAGVVLDFSRHMNTIRAISEPSETNEAGAPTDSAVPVVDVQPGVVLSELTRHVEAATGSKLTFAPDPSSKSRATVGGAIGNDACGNHSVRYGRTSDHVVEIDVVTTDGARLTATTTGLRATDPAGSSGSSGSSGADAAARAAELNAEFTRLAGEHLAAFRTELGQIQRQVSGYHLEALLPESRLNIARALVGTEGTCAVVVGARMRLVPKPAAALLVCLGYDDVVEAARDVPTILEFSPAAVEGTDEAIVETMRFRRGDDAVQGLPAGRAWLYVDLDGDDADVVREQSDRLLARLEENGRLVDGVAVPDPQRRADLWAVREAGAGLSARLASGGESWPGWEDSAVAPEKLADYLADLRELLNEHGLDGVMYGHFGAGCMHIRITYDLRSAAGRETFRAFTTAAARLVVRHGGSLSGEHGDGRARSEFLPIMYSPELLAAFDTYRRAWDPHRVLNPGTLTEPEPMDAQLALAGVPDRQWRTSFDLTPKTVAGQTAPDPWVHAAQGCIGVGKCRSDSGGVMCPSYRATRDERDSTRGRARVLQEMVRGAETVQDGWRSEEVRDVLDLCLSCKACSTDCPVGVDMATYKAEFFDHYYRGRLRPMSHYSMGWLPAWVSLAGKSAPLVSLVNTVLGTRLGRAASALGGLATQRVMPRFAPTKRWRREVDDALGSPAHGSGDTVLFVDTFTKGFRPEVAGAAARVLSGCSGSSGSDSGDDSVECSAEACCGLTWISTGQLTIAKKVLARTAQALDDGTNRPIVVVEPSCAAALHKDLPELIHTDQARRVASRVRSFAGHVTERVRAGWTPTPATELPDDAVLQTHCHEYSVFGATTQRDALSAVGIPNVREAEGCCGVAGNFGFEAEHYDVSMQVAEQALAPALRSTGAETTVITDGFSCAMQVDQLGKCDREEGKEENPRAGTHLAQLLDPGTAPHHN